MKLYSAYIRAQHQVKYKITIQDNSRYLWQIDWSEVSYAFGVSHFHNVHRIATCVYHRLPFQCDWSKSDVRKLCYSGSRWDRSITSKNWGEILYYTQKLTASKTATLVSLLINDRNENCRPLLSSQRNCWILSKKKKFYDSVCFTHTLQLAWYFIHEGVSTWY